MPESLSILTTLIAASFAFWGLANVERLKNMFEKERRDQNDLFQQTTESLRLEFDRVRRVYDINVKKEYELYEVVYENVREAEFAFSQTRSLESDVDILESVEFGSESPSDERVKSARTKQLDTAFDKLGFVDNIRKRKPFISASVYVEIEKFFQMGYDTWFSRKYPALSKVGEAKREYSSDEFEKQVAQVAMRISERLGIETAGNKR